MGTVQDSGSRFLGVSVMLLCEKQRDNNCEENTYSIKVIDYTESILVT